MFDIFIWVVKALGIEKIIEKLPQWAKNTILVIMIAIGLGVLGFLAYTQYFKKPDFLKIMVNLHGKNGLSDNPLKEGSLIIMMVNEDFGKDGRIRSDGKVFFDSIPIQFKNKLARLTLNSTHFQMKYSNQNYPLQNQIDLTIEEVPSNFTTKVEAEPKAKNELKCPQTSPSGVPLNQDIPSYQRVGYKWISGYYEKKNGGCEWFAGTWKKITSNDCPQSPPAGYTETPVQGARIGFEWVKGHWVFQDGNCIWKSGTWERKRSNASSGGVPPPTHVSPSPYPHNQ